MDTSIPKSGTDNGPGLIECLTVERQASMFYDYMRDSGMVVSTLAVRKLCVIYLPVLSC